MGFWKEVRKRLDKVDKVVFFGAGLDIRKPKGTERRLIDFLNWLDYCFFTLLDWLDSCLMFGGRRIRTENGRVRSRAERKLVRYFNSHGIRYQYESKLKLEGIVVRPDFYLLDLGVYVELWGLIADKRYRKMMSLKKRLYHKHQVPIISVYPRHLDNLERHFPLLFEKTTNRPFIGSQSSQTSLKGGEVEG